MVFKYYVLQSSNNQREVCSESIGALFGAEQGESGRLDARNLCYFRKCEMRRGYRESLICNPSSLPVLWGSRAREHQEEEGMKRRDFSE